MKVLLPLGLVFVPVAALLLARPLAAPAANAEPTPPPLATPATALPFPPTAVVALPAPVVIAPEAKPPADEKPAATREQGGGPKFMGAMTCSSSLCHGGGSAERDAYTIWKKSDPHRNSNATLSGTRAVRIAQGMALANAAGSARCTVCHTPLVGVPEERLPAGFDARAEGVSCESCHGAAQNWMRSHTRRDFTHAQNVQTGVRELRGLYARANSCVACHQVIAPALLTAGHPPLLFELDAQQVAEPRHWTEVGDYIGPQAWLTGQAVALREMSWSLAQPVDSVPEAREQWRALLWLLQRTADARGDHSGLPGFDPVPDAANITAATAASVQTRADEFARTAARLDWSRASTRRCLQALAATDKEFTPSTGGEGDLALRSRAQRLALALSRLLAPLQKQDMARWTPASQELDKLFAAADARAIFNGVAFSDQLRKFSAEVSKVEAD